MRTTRLLPLVTCIALLGAADARRSPTQAPQLANGTPLADTVRASAAQRSWVYYVIYVPAGSTSLAVDLYGMTGDLDLYVRRLDAPSHGAFDCRPYLTGTAAESCAFGSPAPGLYWIGVNNYDTGTLGFTIRATWSCPAGGCNVTSLENGLPLPDSITASTPQSAWRHYYVAMPPGGTSMQVELTGLTGDVDLYLGRVDQPTLVSYQCRSIAGGTADEQCGFDLPSSGLWWVSVNNYDVGTTGYTVRASWEILAPRGVAGSDTIIGPAPEAAWNDRYVIVPPGASSLVVDLFDMTGDVDLYLRHLSKPTLSAFDCRPLVGGLGAEQCTIPAPAAGLWWVSVNNYDVGPIHYVLRAAVTCPPGTCSAPQGILVGLGPGATSLPRSAWVALDPVAGGYSSGVAPYAHYNTLQAGVNVGGAELDGVAPGEYMTGPGNVAVFGPHVRAWAIQGAPLSKVNFFAYGTLRYGVKVRGLQGDADGFDEIITGAGQGAVFAPHVRAWNFDGTAIGATATSFFAYPSYRYGVNLDTVDLNGAGRDELLTAPVYGAGYATNVKGWDIDVARQAAPISSINFFAFTNPNDRGCTVAGGDVDGDGTAEIVAGRGPVAGLPADVKGFWWDGANVYAYPALDFVAFSGTTYGTNLALPDLDGNGAAEIAATPGPDPAALPVLRGLDFTGTGVAPIPGLDGTDPFTEFSGARHGATLGIAER